MVYEFSRVSNREGVPTVIFQNPDDQKELPIEVNRFMQGRYPEYMNVKNMPLHEIQKAVLGVMEAAPKGLRL
mgnify:CR=1 FL=1